MASETKIINCPRCGSDELGHGFSFPPMQGEVRCYACEHYVVAPSESDAILLWNAQPALPDPAPEKAGEVET